MAQSWLVLEISGSSFWLGVDSFLGQIPIFLFSILGGAIADRKDRRTLLLGSQWIQLTCAFVLAGLFTFTKVHVWEILILSFTVGLAQSFGGPAYQALIPTLVESKDLQNAIALNSIQFNLARIIGPMLGGLALTYLGAAWCFGLNGASYIAVIISLLIVQPRMIPSKGQMSLMNSMKEGLMFVRGNPTMMYLIVLAFCMTLLAFPVMVFLPVLVKDVYHEGPGAFTRLLSISGAGSVFGALVVAGLGHVKQKDKVALIMLGCLGLLIVSLALSQSLLFSSIIIFLNGATLIAVFAMVSSLVQLLVEDEMRGRVMSVYNVAFRGGMPIGSLIAGKLIEVFSAPPVLAVNGILLIALSLGMLVQHRRMASLIESKV